MEHNKTVLITGAAGGVGRTLVRALSGAHWRIKGLVRPEDRLEGMIIDPEDITTGYIEDPESVFGAMRSVDVVINCAALLPNAIEKGAEAFERVNVAGSLNVLRQAARRHIKHVVFFSTFTVVDHVNLNVGWSDMQDYIKNSPDPYKTSKINAEKALRAESVSFPGKISILRPTFIYGPGNFAVWQDALRLIKRGKMVIIGDGNVSLPLIYADDIAEFILLLLDQPVNKPAFEIYLLSSSEPTTMREVFRFMTDYLGAPPPRHVPYIPIRLAASLAAFLPGPLKRGRLKLLTKDRVQQYSKGFDLSGVLNLPPLGYVPPTSYRVGLPKMLDDYQFLATVEER